MTLTRTVNGLIFSDDFNRANGAPGSNWAADSGTAATIVGGKLVHNHTAGGTVYTRCVGMASTVDALLQVRFIRSSTGLAVNSVGRRGASGIGNLFFISDLAVATDGNANKARVYSNVNGTYFGPFGVDPRVYPSTTEVQCITLQAKQRQISGMMNGYKYVEATDQPAVVIAGHWLIGSAYISGSFGTVSFLSVIGCTDRIVIVTGLPANYRIRVGGFLSAVSSSGTCTLDCQGAEWPAALEVLDASGVVVDAKVGIYGGDTYAYVAAAIASTGLTRSSTGLLLADDFNRADGAPGANYSMDAGTWAIVSNKLSAAAAATVRLIGVAARKDTHVQFLGQRASLATYLTAMLRKATSGSTTYYQADIGGSGDGTDPSKNRLYKRVAGTFTRLTGGIPPTLAVNTDVRYNFSVIGSEECMWVDGIYPLRSTDATVALDVAGYLAIDTNAAAKIENLIVCSSRTITVSGVPSGGYISCGGYYAAESGSGTATLDILGALMPADLVVFDSAGLPVARFTTVYGGDVFAFVLNTVATPTISASPLETGATLTRLVGSAFSGTGTHTYSRWQVTLASDPTFASPLYDPGNVAANTSQWVYGLPTGADVIARVRYVDELGTTSSWSTPVAISLVSQYTFPASRLAWHPDFVVGADTYSFTYPVTRWIPGGRSVGVAATSADGNPGNEISLRRYTLGMMIRFTDDEWDMVKEFIGRVQSGRSFTWIVNAEDAAVLPVSYTVTLDSPRVSDGIKPTRDSSYLTLQYIQIVLAKSTPFDAYYFPVS